MTLVVLTRHGESEWNSTRLLTGWSDPPLSDRGRGQARRAGTALAARRVGMDRVYTSLLTRATQTASIMLAAAGAWPVPVHADWRLNERHLGLLEGMTKAEVAARWGNERRKRWRDDPGLSPPPIDPADPAHPRHDPRYRHVRPDRLPRAERGSDTASRVLEFWHERVVPDLEAGRNVLVVTHLGPLRVLARHCCPDADADADADATGRRPERWENGQPVLCRVAARTCCGAGRPQPANARPQVPWGV